MPKLIVINQEVNACSGCVYSVFDNDFDGWNCVKIANYPQIPDPSTIPSWCPLPDAPAPAEKRCGTCGFWNRREGRTSGDCRYVITVPVALRAVGGHWCFTFESDGTDCPTWAAKENNG